MRLRRELVCLATPDRLVPISRHEVAVDGRLSRPDEWRARRAEWAAEGLVGVHPRAEDGGLHAHGLEHRQPDLVALAKRPRVLLGNVPAGHERSTT